MTAQLRLNGSVDEEEYARLAGYIWKAYPGRKKPGHRRIEKGSRSKAIGLITTALKRKSVTFDDLMAAVVSYGKTTDPQFVMDCARWMRERKWETEAEEAQPKKQARPRIEIELERLRKRWPNGPCDTDADLFALLLGREQTENDRFRVRKEWLGWCEDDNIEAPEWLK
jgi:hypothetical protein